MIIFFSFTQGISGGSSVNSNGEQLLPIPEEPTVRTEQKRNCHVWFLFLLRMVFFVPLKVHKKSMWISLPHCAFLCKNIAKLILITIFVSNKMFTFCLCLFDCLIQHFLPTLIKVYHGSQFPKQRFTSYKYQLNFSASNIYFLT